jgi:molybdopterin synthase catalytic subunit
VQVYDNAHEGTGAICCFRGTTRQEEHATFGTLQALDYEAYEPMATAQLTRIADDIAARFSLLELEIVHAVGRVAVGETSVFIAAAAAHRDDAFRGARAAIDQLKESVPIYKRECFERGATWSRGDEQAC